MGPEKIRTGEVKSRLIIGREETTNLTKTEKDKNSLMTTKIGIAFQV